MGASRRENDLLRRSEVDSSADPVSRVTDEFPKQVRQCLPIVLHAITKKLADNLV